ncbi:class I SAM-dependent methyltransferase [Solibacillus merdavium]|uniref:Class I SAM-dependent methyltransferase n=1 Tax=Solibacillus merdavium TaxID=2762218 RepID=A0ABR8XKT1_9BACL|nr:class I SAM-dependent methyltransferase [Solibacillus merdavium]MBD8032540.1 class I SAM-dependent methyltransferase [Solibacillus merdavium]
MNNIIENNKKSWDIVAKHFAGGDALPGYGPLAQTEEELHLIGSVAGKKVLEIGFGSGHSLLYMNNNGAKELWGVDFSSEQKELAQTTLNGIKATLHTAPMEQEIGLPKNYFDLVYSIYAIGWSSDLSATFKLIHSYLKDGGEFVFSWEHPFYSQIKCRDHQFLLTDSYQREGYIETTTFKGEDAPMQIPKYKMATFINALLRANFELVEIIESDIPEQAKTEEVTYSERYYSLHKASHFPTTFIVKAIKRS